jgi:hypothetical protein
MAHVVESLPSKCEVLSSNSSAAGKKKKSIDITHGKKGGLFFFFFGLEFELRALHLFGRPASSKDVFL